MPKLIVTIVALALAAVGGYALSALLQSDKSVTERSTANASTTGSSSGPSAVGWTAAAPGRVEPRNGEIRIAASLLGRVAEIRAKTNRKVEENELLILLDDAEIRAKLAAAEAAAATRKEQRDKAPKVSGRENVTRALDAVYSAERQVTGARYGLDFAIKARRDGTGSERALSEARRRLSDAQDRLSKERLALAAAQTRPGLPPPNEIESGLAAARAEVALAQSLLDKSRIRAPAAGTILQIDTKVGELVAPSPQHPLIMMGDLGLMRVKAEVDAPDISKIKLNQRVVVRSKSYPDREFKARVYAIAPALSSPMIGQRGPRRPTDVEVMEVTVDLEGNVPLKSGMRVDAFFYDN